MSKFRKLDSKRRAIFPDCFSPGDLILEEEVASDRVVFRLIKATEPPLVGVKSINGLLMAQAQPDFQTIRDAIRDDRDAR